MSLDRSNVYGQKMVKYFFQVVESKSSFTVVKGESAPKIGDVGPVTGVAKKQCNMTIPYQVITLLLYLLGTVLIYICAAGPRYLLESHIIAF